MKYQNTPWVVCTSVWRSNADSGVKMLKFLLVLTLMQRDIDSSFSLTSSPSVHHFRSSVTFRARRSRRDRSYQVRYSVDDNDGDDSQAFTQSRYGRKNQKAPERPPIPAMPSELFRKMAHSQLELLANSFTQPGRPSKRTKVESMALYLPQENANTGQLEFTPIVLYPDPNTERVFIAPDAESGQAPTLPKALTKLPGFAHATTLLPGYPMISSSSDEAHPGVGVVEEVLCDSRFKNKAAALSVPLLSGSQTVGVLLVSPAPMGSDHEESFWTEFDREQVSRAAQSLSMALSMDNERNILREQNDAFREGLLDSLHQVKNPLQALRTYGKLLQRQILAGNTEDLRGTPQLLNLAERLMVQSERVVDLLVPMDTLVEDLYRRTPLAALTPAKNDTVSAPPSQPIVLWEEPSATVLPWENDTLEFARENGTTVMEFASQSKNVNRAPRKRNGNGASTMKSTSSPPAVESPSAPSTSVVGDLEMEMTFVADVLEPIFSAFQAIAFERNVGFEVVEESKDELPGVLAAPRALQEAVCNVLDNAFKYVMVPKDGSPFTSNPSPRVRVRMFANDFPAGVTLVVEDNGPGIRDEDKERIFQRGFRSEATMVMEGSGIGLDISQALMQQMGGILTVADPGGVPGGCLDGAVMKFTLFRKPYNVSS